MAALRNNRIMGTEGPDLSAEAAAVRDDVIKNATVRESGSQVFQMKRRLQGYAGVLKNLFIYE